MPDDEPLIVPSPDDAAPWHPHCERCGRDLPDDAPVLTCADCLKEMGGGS